MSLVRQELQISSMPGMLNSVSRFSTWTVRSTVDTERPSLAAIGPRLPPNLDNTKRCRNSRKQRNEERDLDMKELDRVTKEYDDLKERVDNTEYWLSEARRLFLEM